MCDHEEKARCCRTERGPDRPRQPPSRRHPHTQRCPRPPGGQLGHCRRPSPVPGSRELVLSAVRAAVSLGSRQAGARAGPRIEGTLCAVGSAGSQDTRGGAPSSAVGRLFVSAEQLPQPQPAQFLLEARALGTALLKPPPLLPSSLSYPPPSPRLFLLAPPATQPCRALGVLAAQRGACAAPRPRPRSSAPGPTARPSSAAHPGLAAQPVRPRVCRRPPPPPRIILDASRAGPACPAV